MPVAVQLNPPPFPKSSFVEVSLRCFRGNLSVEEAPSLFPLRTRQKSFCLVTDKLLPIGLRQEEEVEAREGIKSLMFLDMMGIEAEKALRKNPSLKSTPVERIYDVVDFLQSMGLSIQDLTRIFDMHPTILSRSVDDLKELFDFLKDEVQFPRKNFKRALKKHPVFLTLSVENRLRPCFYFLQRLGLPLKSFSDGSNLVLLGFNVERCLVPKLQYLESLGMSKRQATIMAIRSPEILTYSVDYNLKPKYEYLKDEMGKSLRDLMQFPQYFSFSLEKRIKVRHKLMIEYTVSLSLFDMLQPKDDDFMNTLNAQHQRRIKYSKLKK